MQGLRAAAHGGGRSAAHALLPGPLRLPGACTCRHCWPHLHPLGGAVAQLCRCERAPRKRLRAGRGWQPRHGHRASWRLDAGAGGRGGAASGAAHRPGVRAANPGTRCARLACMHMQAASGAVLDCSCRRPITGAPALRCPCTPCLPQARRARHASALVRARVQHSAIPLQPSLCPLGCRCAQASCTPRACGSASWWSPLARALPQCCPACCSAPPPPSLLCGLPAGGWCGGGDRRPAWCVLRACRFMHAYAGHAVVRAFLLAHAQRQPALDLSFLLYCAGLRALDPSSRPWRRAWAETSCGSMTHRRRPVQSSSLRMYTHAPLLEAGAPSTCDSCLAQRAAANRLSAAALFTGLAGPA